MGTSKKKGMDCSRERERERINDSGKSDAIERGEEAAFHCFVLKCFQKT